MGVWRYRWAEVGEEVQEAVQAGRLGLSQEQVHAQLCQALLRSARFNLAKQYLTGQSMCYGVTPRALLVCYHRLPFCSLIYYQASRKTNAERCSLFFPFRFS